MISCPPLFLPPVLMPEAVVPAYIEKGRLFPTKADDFIVTASDKGKLIIKPSHKSMSRMTKKISGVIKDNRAATQETLIRRLNEVIVGWADYHHSTCAKRSFSTIDHRIWEMLWRWSKRRHPNKSKSWIVRRYWKTHKGRKWTFMSDKNVLFLMMDMPIVRKGQMALDKNPFLDPGYFEQRAKKHRLNRKKAICSNRAAQIGYYAL